MALVAIPLWSYLHQTPCSDGVGSLGKGWWPVKFWVVVIDCLFIGGGAFWGASPAPDLYTRLTIQLFPDKRSVKSSTE